MTDKASVQKTTLEEARAMADRDEPLPEDFYIDQRGDVQWKPGREKTADNASDFGLPNDLAKKLFRLERIGGPLSEGQSESGKSLVGINDAIREALRAGLARWMDHPGVSYGGKGAAMLDDLTRRVVEVINDR